MPAPRRIATLQHVEASACELVGHRFDGHDAVSLGFLPLIKFASGFAITDREIGSFDIRPGQKTVSVLGISFALFLPIRHVGTSDAATIRRVISNVSKAANIASLQQNYSCQDRPDAGNGTQKTVVFVAATML